jgi:hypothetical protein
MIGRPCDTAWSNPSALCKGVNPLILISWDIESTASSVKTRTYNHVRAGAIASQIKTKPNPLMNSGQVLHPSSKVAYPKVPHPPKGIPNTGINPTHTIEITNAVMIRSMIVMIKESNAIEAVKREAPMAAKGCSHKQTPSVTQE